MNNATFSTAPDIAAAYPYAGSPFVALCERFMKKHAGATIDVATISPGRWTAVVRHNERTVTGGEATSESNAIRLALKAW
jgi:hypothetical protein